MRPKLLQLVTTAASVGGLVAYLRYKKELRSLETVLDTGSTIAETAAGEIEYAEAGDGRPVLVIHGAGGGYDQGLVIGADLGEGYRVIAPSRFGYLKTPAPEDPSPAAQGDAHAALLDFLDIGKAIVVGASAGAPSAIELALRHPDRVSALILIVPRTYDPSGSIGVDDTMQSQAVLRLVESSADFFFWVAKQVSRSSVVRFLGVPPELEASATAEERARVTRIIESILPLSKRVRGIALDSAAQIAPWPLSRVSCPVLIVSAEDDLFGTLPGARFTAEHLPDAQLHVFPSGGHLLVGRSSEVRHLVGDFLEHVRQSEPKRVARSNPRQLEAVAS